MKKQKVLKKGLTYAEAKKQFPWRKGMGDVRGFGYNPKTGLAKWI